MLPQRLYPEARRREKPSRRPASLRAVALACVLVLIPLVGGASDASRLQVTGMTFIANRGDGRDLVLRADRAILTPHTQQAEIFEVRAELMGLEGDRNFTMHCDRAQLNIETNDFEATGNVSGTTAAGERYTAPWVRYVHEDDLLYTDAPVRLVDDTGHFSGNGFRYHVAERRFKLLGDVRVVQGR